MRLLRSNKSDETFSEDCGSFQEALGEKEVRIVYLITYSQANLDRFPMREEFASVVVQSFVKFNAKILQWCCSCESHKKSGKHSHLSLKLDCNQCWLSSKEFLLKECGINANCSSNHHNYYSAWTYVTKEDENFVKSAGQLDFKNAGEPKTSVASRAKLRNKCKRNAANKNRGDEDDQDSDDDKDTDSRTSARSASTRKRKRLTTFKVTEIIVDRGALAHQQKNEGKTDLVEFVVNRPPRAVADILNTVWEIESAAEKLARSKKTRLELLQEAKEKECTKGCNGLWKIFVPKKS